jgi:hypothetical protein
MARLEAQSKLLYYPTPNPVVDAIATWFSAPKPARLADPCCGTGEALKRLADWLGCGHQTWGIELSYSRAEAAANILDTVLPVSFYTVKWGPKSVSLVLDNAPYDFSAYTDKDGKHLRHEFLFVTQVTPRIVPGGHHIIIVPRAMLGSEAFARHLAGWYDETTVMRFPDGLYDTFSQVVILACNKREKHRTPTAETVTAITTLADEATEIPVLVAGDGRYEIPPIPSESTFSYQPVEPLDLVRAGNRCSPIGSAEYRRATYVRPLGAAFHPAMPLGDGHITMLISGGETGIIRLDENGRSCLLKGMSKKVATGESREFYDEEGDVAGESVSESEAHISTLAIVRADGTTNLIEDPAQFERFVKDHAAAIAQAILGKNQPTYDFDPTPAEWKTTGKIALGLPPLPGRAERGLLDAQRHFAIAGARVMKKHGTAILNAAMGFGKTASTVAMFALTDAWPGLVVCPGHITWKWKRDIERASDPDDPITARVITRPVRGEIARWAGIKAAIEAAGGQVSETSRSQVYPQSQNDPGTRRRVVIACVPSHLDGVLKVIGSLTFRDKGQDDATTLCKPVVQLTTSGIEVEYVDRDDYTLFDFVDDYRAGRLGHKAVAICSQEAAKYDAGVNLEIGAKLYRDRPYFDTEKNAWVKARVRQCPHCGMATSKDRCNACNRPLVEKSRWRLVGLAQLVQRKLRDFFQVYVADEVHRAQDGRSDQGFADQRLLSSCRYSLALTGTLFGGTAGSLFYLLYRRVPAIRQQYAFSDKTRWVDHYGLWKREWKQSEPYVSGKGASGVERWGYRQDELPGVGPGVIRYLLPITLFGSIEDLGYELPACSETIERVAMTPAQAAQYDQIENDLLRKALDLRQKCKDGGAIAAWFNACRFRPSSAFRPEVVSYTSSRGKGGSLFMELPAVTSAEERWLPKEIRLAEIVRGNMEQGRKTLVFVEQSGERDIRTRLKHALDELVPGGDLTLVEAPRFTIVPNPRVGILSADDMPPARREAWIACHAPELDALLLNPRIVETGLDLIQFSDVVFYETTVSLYTLMQSMKRVHRLGQSRDVTITFLAYRGTVEVNLLDKMARKMTAAVNLYGKSAEGALVSASSEDVMRELIGEALRGEDFKNARERIEAFRAIAPFGVSKTSAGKGAKSLPIPVAATPQGDLLVVATPFLTVTQLPSGDVRQLDLFGGSVTVLPTRRRK